MDSSSRPCNTETRSPRVNTGPALAGAEPARVAPGLPAPPLSALLPEGGDPADPTEPPALVALALAPLREPELLRAALLAASSSEKSMSSLGLLSLSMDGLVSVPAWAPDWPGPCEALRPSAGAAAVGPELPLEPELPAELELLPVELEPPLAVVLVPEG